MAVQNSLARQDQSMKLSVYLQNDAVKKQINQVVGGKNGTRFISSIVSAVQSTPALQECTSPSIVNAALLGEALNLIAVPAAWPVLYGSVRQQEKGLQGSAVPAWL